MKRLLVLCAVCSLFLGARLGVGAPALVTVDATTGVVLGNVPRISSDLFGLTAFEGGPMMVADLDYRARIMALRPGCIRFAGNVSWCCPPKYDPAWYQTPAALKEFTQVLLFGSRYPTGRFLPIVRSMGAEPMCSLGGVPKYLRLKGTPDPANFDKWAATCAAYVGLWKKVDPRFRLVQVWNEPNAHWYKDPRASDKGTTAADLHIEMANKVARAIKAKFPDVLVGGPVLCWPPAWPPHQKGKKPWYTWNDWTLPWLKKTAGTIDFFDFHVYSISPQDFAVQTSMLVNQSELTQGRRIPVWITESNINLKNSELNDPRAIWSKRLLPYERFLLHGILPQADKVRGNLYHDLHARQHTLLPHGANNPDPMYWLLWILRDLRGLRVKTTVDNPALTAYATVDKDRVTTVLFNDSDQEADTTLRLTIPGGYWTGPYIRLLRQNAAGDAEPGSLKAKFQRHGSKAMGHIVLPPHATASINFRMASFCRSVRQEHVVESFGDKTLRFLSGKSPATVAIALADPNAGPVRLRLGLLGPEASDAVSCTLNGTPLPIQSTALQEIPVPATLLQKHNRLVVSVRQSVPNPRLALGFASLCQTVAGPAE